MSKNPGDNELDDNVAQGQAEHVDDQWEVELNDGQVEVPMAKAEVDLLDSTERKISRPSLYKSNSNPLRPNGDGQPTGRGLRRAFSIREKISHETAKFFGVSMPAAMPAPPTSPTTPDSRSQSPVSPVDRPLDEKWKKRRFRHLNSLYGVKPKEVADQLQNVETQPDSAETYLPDLSVYTAIPLEPEKRESVAKMALNAFTSFIQGDLFRGRARRRRISTLVEERRPGDSIVPPPAQPYKPIRERNQLRNNRSFPLAQHALLGNASPRRRATLRESKVDSSPSETPAPELSAEPNAVRPHRALQRTDQPTDWDRTLFVCQPSVSVVNESEDAEDGMEMREWPRARQAADEPEEHAPHRAGSSHSATQPLFLAEPPPPPDYAPGDELLDTPDLLARFHRFPTEPAEPLLPEPAAAHTPHQARTPATSTPGQRRFGCHYVLKQKDRISVQKIGQFVEKPRRVNRERQLSFLPRFFHAQTVPQRSLPIFGKFKRARLDPNTGFVMKQLEDEGDDYRPFFTYWVTTVQVVIMLFSLFYYGIGTDFTHGLGVIERSGDVLASSMSVVHIVVWEQNNIWIGPRFADLVHMGAKYTPCMRRDTSIHKLIAEEREAENRETGCCVGPDGCFQTSACPKQFARFYKNIDLGQGSMQRVVCGQDPRYCDTPKSVTPFEWGPNITDWPICQEKRGVIPKREEHMHCEVTGRPCCIQMHGQCRITTREYCDFVRGYYHENATLCSQVSCLNDVCGMTPFLNKDRPDQFYRFFIPLFIHAGVVRCVITCAIQLTIMRRFELMIGCFRLALIYFVSGVGGYLASASFSPFMPEVGPAGSQGGVLGALIVNVIYNWNYLRNPTRALFEHLALAVALFVTGFLPYIDNWAQATGFIFGMLMAAALIPYISFGQGTRLLIVVFSLLITVVLFAFLLVLFYGLPVIDSPLLTILNCPFSGHICDQQGLTLRSWLPI